MKEADNNKSSGDYKLHIKYKGDKKQVTAQES